MKKFLSLLVFFTMLLSLVACSAQNNDNNGNGGNTEKEPTTIEEYREKINEVMDNSIWKCVGAHNTFGNTNTTIEYHKKGELKTIFDGMDQFVYVGDTIYDIQRRVKLPNASSDSEFENSYSFNFGYCLTVGMGASPTPYEECSFVKNDDGTITFTFDSEYTYEAGVAIDYNYNDIVVVDKDYRVISREYTVTQNTPEGTIVQTNSYSLTYDQEFSITAPADASEYHTVSTLLEFNMYNP